MRAFEKEIGSEMGLVRDRIHAISVMTYFGEMTDELFRSLEKRGIGFETVTLHVGAGTFLPVKVEDTEDHPMHSEWGILSPTTVQRINSPRRAGGRIVADNKDSFSFLRKAKVQGVEDVIIANVSEVAQCLHDSV